jgi:hypothetical protein
VKVGNTIHAVVLAVIAFAAIAFLVVRLIPQRPRAVTAVAASRPAAGTHLTVAGLPVEVLRDAFSHPALTKKYLASLPKKSTPAEAEVEAPWKIALGSNLPPAFAGDIQPDVKPDQPGENTGTSRQDEGRPKSKFELKAIMRATTPLALITVDDKTDLTVGLGEYIDINYRITKFSQDGIQLAHGSTKSWLYVGQEVNEK